MATDVIYGSITMHNVQTRLWEEEAVYDESDTDRVMSKYRLEFEGVIHLNLTMSNTTTKHLYVLPTGGVGVLPQTGTGPTTPTQVYQMIRACLLEPRQELTVNFNGETVLHALHVDGGTDPDCDVDNGPKPRHVRLTHIASNNVFHVSFAIDVAKHECCTTYKAPDLVLNSRWSVTESMDSNFFTTRTARGRIRCSQAMANNLHSLRPSIMPTLEPGFRRESIEFSVLPSGLECDWTVIDRQVHTAAPAPATSISGRFTESNDQNVACFSELQIKLVGSPEADKRLLLTQAANVAAARLGEPNTWTAKNGVYIEQIQVTENIGEENSVELLCRLRRIIKNDDTQKAFIGDLPLDISSTDTSWGTPLALPDSPTNYDPASSRVPWFYGYTPNSSTQRDPSDTTNPAAVLYAMRCFLQTPCVDDHEMAEVTGLIGGALASEDSEPAGPEVTVETTAALPDWTPAASSLLATPDAGTLYLFYRYSSEYISKRVRVGLPVAGDVTASSTDATKMITLGRPQCSREIIVDAERVGAPPTLPAPLETYSDGQIKGTLLDHRVESFPSTLSVDGTTRVFRRRGRYRYQLNRPPLESESMLVGKLPFLAVDQDAERDDPATLYDPSLGPGVGSESLGLIASE